MQKYQEMTREELLVEQAALEKQFEEIKALLKQDVQAFPEACFFPDQGLHLFVFISPFLIHLFPSVANDRLLCGLSNIDLYNSGG